MSGTAHPFVSHRHKKRSGIPIAPSETESAAGRENAKRPTPSPMRRDCCGRCERFPRKDPGVFDLLGSSLSCAATGLTPPLSISTYGLPNFVSQEHKRREGPIQGSAAAPHAGYFKGFHPCVCRELHNCSAASLRRYRRSFSSGGPSGSSRPLSRNTFGSLTQALSSRQNRHIQQSSRSINHPSRIETSF